MAQEPFFLKSGNQNLYGVLFTPDDSEPEQVVMFCHPLFEEKKSSHRVFVELARKLAKQNIASLMLDFTSCGDSEGGIEDFIPAKWLTDIQSGINHLKKVFKKPQITLLGIRFGAALALQFVSKNKGIEKLILIDPVIKGKAYLDEILQQKYIREMMTFGKAKSDIKEMEDELKASNKLDIDGVLVNADFFNEVEVIDLEENNLESIRNIFLVQQAPKSNLLQVYEEFRKNCWAMEVKLDLELLKCPPFWKAVDLADFKKICEVILKWKKIN